MVAGKTGTAQKIDASGRYSMIDHVASFVGFVPASRPALVILVSLDTPRGPRNQGGDVAAPLFARIAEQALRRLAVPPDDPDARAARWSRTARTPRSCPRPTTRGAACRRAGAGDADEPGLMPDLRGRSAREAAIAGRAPRPDRGAEGLGPRDRADAREPGAEIEAGHACVLTLEPRVAAEPGEPP